MGMKADRMIGAVLGGATPGAVVAENHENTIHGMLPHQLPNRCWIAPSGEVHKLNLAQGEFHMQWVEGRGQEHMAAHTARYKDGKFDHVGTFENMFKAGWIRVDHPNYETHHTNRSTVVSIANKRARTHGNPWVSAKLHQADGTRSEDPIKGDKEA
jgi:hypothetical protein